MTNGDAGAESAVDTPADDYVLYSETVAKEAEKSAPEETKANEAKLPDTDEAEDAEPDEGESSKTRYKPNGFKRKLEASAARIAELEAQLRQKTSEPITSQEPENNGRPNANDPKYQTPEGIIRFFQDDNEWLVKQTLRSQEDERKQQDQKQAQEDAKAQRIAHIDERLETFTKQHPDYVEKVSAIVQAGLVTPAIEQAVLDCDASEMVSYYLANNPTELMALHGMSEVQLNRAIAKLEVKLESEQGQAAVRTTRAAAPISPVKTSASTQKSVSDDLPYEEWKKLRESSLRR